MPEEPNVPPAPQGPARSKDEIALELMKFVAVTTGYGKPASSPGFAGKGVGKTPEEHAEALLQLFAKCRDAVEK
jgi:hypothetical protein